MKVSIVRGGGVTGMTTLTELDEHALSTEASTALRQKMADAEAALPAQDTSAGEGPPDAQQYELTLEGDHGARTVRLDDASLSGPVRSLIEWVDTQPERTMQIVPPGSAH
jgi:hypothetical protein